MKSVFNNNKEFKEEYMKSKTHIYMANLILDELSSGKLTLNQMGTYAVPQQILEAIIGNPDQFRAGSIAPDFLPDVIAGQTVIHPENSGEWLEYLYQALLELSPKDPKRKEIMSFFCGVMMHYAGDLYGHDYVNGWAGGWFPSISDILSDPEKAKIVIRHILVEAYMDQKVPANENLTIKVPAFFLKQCFDNPEAVRRYPADNQLNILNYMSSFSNAIHNTSQKNNYASLNVFNYFNCWDTDIENGILEWVNTWGRIASDSMSKKSVTKMKTDIEEWFSYYFLKMIGVPDFFVEAFHLVTEVIDNLAILNQIKELLLNTIKNLIIHFVSIATGKDYEEIEAALQELKDILKNPATYLNNGRLFTETNITEQLDRDFGNFGQSRNTNDQSFSAFYNCLNMCKLCLIGPNNLNALALANGGVTQFEHKRSISTIRNLIIVIKTSDGLLAGTNDNIYFGVTTKDGKEYKLLLDKPGYNDFERGAQDSYRFELPVNIPTSNIKEFTLTKDYIMVPNLWKPKWIRVYNANTDVEILKKTKINDFILDRDPLRFEYKRDKDENTANYLEIDPSIISFMYSLDAKGLGIPTNKGTVNTSNPTLDKQWAHDAFAFYGDSTLRNAVMVPLFNLTPNYSSTIFNDHTLAFSKSRLTRIKVYSGQVISNFQLEYDHEYCTPLHGEGNSTNYNFDLDADEYIKQIKYDIVNYSGNKAVSNLIIVSNKKTSNSKLGETVDSNNTITLTAPDNKQIFALSGHCPIHNSLGKLPPSDITVSLYKNIK
jgi:hypothetical protein